MRLAVLFCCFLSISPGVCSQEPAATVYTDLNPEEFYLLMASADNHIIIDTRSRKEYRKERLPGAKLASNREGLSQLITDLDLEQPILVYCSDNYRSQDACRMLAEKGFKHVYNLRGGLTEWRMSGFAINKKRPPRKNLISQ